MSTTVKRAVKENWTGYPCLNLVHLRTIPPRILDVLASIRLDVVLSESLNKEARDASHSLHDNPPSTLSYKVLILTPCGRAMAELSLHFTANSETGSSVT